MLKSKRILLVGTVFLAIALAMFLAPFASAFSVNTSSYSVDSYHWGSVGNDISTSNYSGRFTTTYQQAGTKSGTTANYTFNSGWFGAEGQEVGNVTINEIFFSNETVFNHSSVFNSSVIVYDMNLTYIGANCTAQTGSVSNVTFRLFNVEDNVNYINTTAHTFNTTGDLYVLNSSYVIRDSGNWTLFVDCSGSSGSPLTNTTMWEIAWGAIQVNLIQPLNDTVVTLYEFFTFSTNVSCSNGECGLVNVTLDPEEAETSDDREEASDNNTDSEQTPSDKILEEVEVNESREEEPKGSDQNKVPLPEINETTPDDKVSEVNETKEIEPPKRDKRVIIINRTNTTISDKNITLSPNETIIERNETNTTVILELGDLISTIVLEANIDVLRQDIVMPRIEEGGIDMPEGDDIRAIDKLIEDDEGSGDEMTKKDGLSEVSDEIMDEASLISGLDKNDKNRIAEPQDIDNFEFNTPIIALELGEESSGNVELPKLRDEAINMIVKCDDWNYRENNCDSEWHYYFDALVDFEQDDENIDFRVRSFSAYAGGNHTGGETAWLIIWDENDIGMPNASMNSTDMKLVNETVKFFADYRIAQNGTKITDGNCSISFSDTSGNMTYNSTYTYYLHERNFTSTGNYPYTVSCTHPTYTDLNTNDSIVIEAFNNETKGAVSTIIGDVPFYTTDGNPQTCTLRGGENCTVIWNVNATGTIGKVYDFFVEAFGYITFNYTANVSNNGSDYYVINVSDYTNSSHVSMQISTNDTTPPVFVFATATPSVVINGSDVTINANVEDNVQVDSVWANITLPDNSTFFMSSLPFVYTTNVSQIGVHTVTFYANDTSGNNASTNKTFVTAPPINITITVEISVDLTQNISSTITASVLVAGTNEVLSTAEINGSTALLLPNVPVDISFETSFDNDTSLTLLFNFNLSESIGGSINFGNILVDPFLLIYGVDTNFSFTSAQVIIIYANVTFTNEDNLQLHKCDSYTVGTGTCISGFNDVTGDGTTTHDKDNNRFIHNTTSFSGFGIREVTPPSGGGTTTGGTTGGGGGIACTYDPDFDWDCGEWSECINEEQTRTCKGINNCGNTFGRPEVTRACEVSLGPPAQLFDISLSLDNTIISSSDELSAVITFESFGVEPTPVDLTFIILDSSGNEIHREGDSITVITEEVFRKSFEGLNLPLGKYTLVLETLYNVDVFDEFRQEFEISPEERVGIPIWVWIIGGIVVSILVIIGIIYYIIRLRKKKIR